MFLKENENTSTNTVKQSKTKKEKTFAAAHATSAAQIDVTQELTQEELYLLSQAQQNSGTHIYPDSVWDYYPGKYQKHTVVDETAKEEKEKEGYISSYVGDYDSNPKKEIIANLGEDVAFVQEHLKRLNILSEKDFNTEKPANNAEVSKSKISKTINAINWFQGKVLHYNTKYGYVVPGKGTINKLVVISVDEKESKYKEYLKKKKEEEKRIALENAKAEREAELERIKNEPATLENLKKYYKTFDSIELFGKFLKDYAILNPQFVLKAYDLMGFGKSDNLTRSIMYNLKDSEIEKLPDSLDLKFYESLDAGWTVDEEYVLMDKLKSGKKLVREKAGEKKENLTNWIVYLKKENKIITDKKILKRITKNRNEITDHTDKLKAHKKGYYYGGSQKGKPSSSKANKAQIAAWEELAGEGGYESINTWDGEVFTWGKGFAAGGQLPLVLEKALASESLKSKFEKVGITQIEGLLYVVDIGSGNVLSGMKGYKYIAATDKLLHFFIELGKDKTDRQKIIDAQYEIVMSKAGKIPDFVIDTKKDKYKGGWNDDAVKLASHLGHWLPAGGWNYGTDLYKGSNGDILKIIQAFCLTLNKKTSIVNLKKERYIWETLKYTAVEHFNHKVFAGGIGMKAVKKECATPIEAKKAKEEDKYKNHILLPIEKAAKYYVIKKSI